MNESAIVERTTVGWRRVSRKTGGYLNEAANLKTTGNSEAEHASVGTAQMCGIRKPGTVRGFGERLFALSN